MHDIFKIWSFRTCEKSTLQENSKQIVLRPALLTRGRMKKPKPNLGVVSKRQAEPPRNSEVKEKTTEATEEIKKTLTQHECRSDLFTKQATVSIWNWNNAFLVRVILV